MSINVNFYSIKNAVLAKGYDFFGKGDYNLNIVGIRSHDRDSNAFNDLLTVSFFVDGNSLLFVFPCTTDAGTYWREHPINVHGTAIVMPGQYSGLWQIGKHREWYEALVQRSPISLYRDNNKDKTLDSGEGAETGLFGINCHRASSRGLSVEVNRWSAGCQVLADSADFSILMALCRKSMLLWGNRFTYTLIEEGDL